jgi:hypothetical protein
MNVNTRLTTFSTGNTATSTATGRTGSTRSSATGLPHAEDETLLTSKVTESSYAELVWIAEGLLRDDRLRWVIEPKEIVHEMYLRIMTRGERIWISQPHFLGTAAIVMRHVLTDLSRRRDAWKGGGNVQFVPLG